jgi:hypothetical protein
MTRLLDKSLKTALAVAVLAALSASTAAASVSYMVNLDTSSVNGTSGFVDLQFNPGNASSQPATIQIVNFDPDGGTLVGAPMITGGVTGVLPGTLTFTNAAALNDYFQQFTYGTHISFTVVLSGPAIDSPNGTATAGSTFSVSLLDSAMNQILSNDPSGAAAQININLDGTTTAVALPNANGGPSIATITAVNAFQVRYAANLNIGDSFIDITNVGASSTTSFPVQNGNLCVNVYTFSPDEQLVSCCSCFVTPNALVSLSTRSDLISNTLTPASPTSVVVKLLSTAAGATAASCNASTVGVGANALTNGLAAWGTTLHALPTTPGTPAVTYGTTETPFIPATLSTAELTRITTLCGLIQTNGSGFGICKACRLGGLGAEKQ